MDYYLTIWSVVVYAENRVQGDFDYEALAQETGFSLAHLRDIFQRCTGKTLHRYVLERKIAYAAFDLAHTTDRILTIAILYGFNGPDTFTRAFRRVTGWTPLAFRRANIVTGRKRLCAGIWGVSVDSETLEGERK